MSIVRLALLSSFALIFATVARAANMTADELAATPQAHLKKEVRLNHVTCIDDPKGSIICVAQARGKLLKIDALVIGEMTSPDTAQRLTEYCQGTANLESRDCSFSVSFIPQTAQRVFTETDEGSLPVVILLAREIDLGRGK